MPLKIELRPGEKLIIAGALITNGGERARFTIEGAVPILREKFILGMEKADTPCKRIYYIIQCMYLSQNPAVLHDEYFTHVRQVMYAAPSIAKMLDNISSLILENNYYEALKQADSLIGQEAAILARG